MAFLEVKNLHANIEGKEILTGLSLNINKGEVHAIMGPNGSGKSTFANVLLGHPKYTITAGDILVNRQSILKLSTDERSKKGLFLGFQYPTEISGVGYSHFLRNAYNTLIRTGAGLVVITHYARILRYLTKLNQVHVMTKGKIIKSGGKELSEELESKGYEWLGVEDK